MGVALQILYFIIVFGGLGYLLLSLLKRKPGRALETVVLSLGIGISAFLLIGALFDIARMPQHWLSFLGVALIAVALVIWKRKLLPLPAKANMFDIIVIALFLINTIIFAHASLQQPGLEDDDPWGIALNTHYVQEYKTYDAAKHGNNDGRAEPYAQGYHLIMGVLAQLSGDVPQTLKLFNALFASLAILFAYLWVSKMFKSDAAGVLASFALLVNPSFTSRFIWPEALATSMALLILYFLAHQDRENIILGGLAYGSMAMLHQRTFIVTTVLVITYFIAVFIAKLRARQPLKQALFNNVFCTGIVAAIAATAYWGMQVIKHGVQGILERGTSEVFVDYWARAIIPFKSYFITLRANDMANPSGIGLVLILIAFIGLLFLTLRKDKHLEEGEKWFLILSFFTLIFLHQGGRLYASLIPIITLWKFIAIPLAALFAYALIKLSLVKIPHQRLIYGFVLGIIILAVTLQSGVPKYAVTTSTWPPGVIWPGGFDTMKPYLELAEEAPDARVLTIGSDKKIIGLGLQTDYLAEDQRLFKQDLLSQDLDSLTELMLLHDYDYVIVDAEILRLAAGNETLEFINTLLTSLQQSQNYLLRYSSQSAFVFLLV